MHGDIPRLQSLLAPSPLQPVLVSIDFEGLGAIRHNFQYSSDTQVGLAILDTRNIKSPSSQIVTHNFITGSDLYFENSAKRFLWGIPKRISSSDMLSEINQYIDQDRNIILIGHSVFYDLQALQALGRDSLNNFTAIFDTGVLAKELKIKNCTGESPPLKILLRELGCRFGFLHNGGNDANFTLRAFLFLAIKALEMEESEGNLERIETLRSIATVPQTMIMLQPLPPDSEPATKRQVSPPNVKNRQKKIARKEKMKRTPEEQQQIRDARLQIRLHATPEKLLSLQREDELQRRRREQAKDNRSGQLARLFLVHCRPTDNCTCE